MAVTPMTGIEVLLKVNTSATETPTWTTVACQRGADLNRSAETIEATFKGSGNWKTYLTGFKEWDISCDGLYAFGETEFKFLEDAFNNNSTIGVELVDANGKGFEGMGVITSFPISMPYDAELTYKLEIKGSGPLTEVTGA